MQTAFGQKTIDGVAYARRDKQHKRCQHLAG